MNNKTPISALQELMAARGLSYPTYIEECLGMSFKCTVIAAGVTATGISSSKKSAKHESAKKALEKLGFSSSSQILILDSTPSIIEKPQKNYVGDLNEFASKKGIKYPDYECINMTSNGEFYHKCRFIEKEVIGKGFNKKDAKQDAAKRMLELVQKMDPILIVGDLYQTNIKSELKITDRDNIIQMYKKLSLKTQDNSRNDLLTEKPEIQIELEDSVQELKNKLKLYRIDYTLQQLQRLPYVMHVQIKGTDLNFIATDITKEEATRKVLQDVLEVYKTGISLQTNDLINFN